MTQQRNLAFGNYYLVNEVEGWAAVCIAKNACTSLKAAVLRSSGRPLPARAPEIHDMIGYQRSELLRPVSEGPPHGMHVFAVWRDPVDRWYSALAELRKRDEIWARRKVLGTHNTARLHLSLAQAVVATEGVLRRPADHCDEHLRRQMDFCDFDALDSVVELKNLDAFFVSHGWQGVPHLNDGAGNEATRTVARDDTASERIRALYAGDLTLLRS